MTTVYCLGDSLTGGWPPSMATRLGWTATLGNQGGTGYLNDGHSVNVAYATFRDRIPLVAAANPDVVMVEGGINDSGFSLAAFTAEVNLFYAALRAACPNAAIYGLSLPYVVWTPLTYNAPIVAAVAAAHGTYLDMAGWFTGTGNAGAPAGDGNLDAYLGADGIHPTTAGYVYMGTRLAFAIRPPATGLDF